jgi:hypothetical protein
MKLFKVEITEYVSKVYLLNAETPDKAAEQVMLGNVEPRAETSTGQIIDAIYEITPKAEKAA